MTDTNTSIMDLFDESYKKTYYLLMNKDEVVAKFSLEEAPSDEIGDIEVFRLPAWIDDFARFIRHRSAPRSREHIKELLTRSGCNTVQGFLDITHALSLTDTFWVKRKDSILKWENVSLFRNPFNEVVAHTAFDGGMYGNNLSTPSPEYGTDGTFAKCWIRENNTIKMLKRGSLGARNAGLEPYSEFYASQVAKAFGCDYVEYKLRNVKGQVCSVCECFTNERYGFVSFANVYRETGSLIKIAEKFRDNSLLQKFADMMVLDALIFNEDRHRGNFGFIFDTDTYEIVDMAPLFDHNISLLCYAEEEDFNDKYVESRLPRFGQTFIQNAKLFLGFGAHRKLINMQNFKFERNTKLGLPEWRLKKLEKLVQNQVKLLLE